jgi:hypothetical protein
MHPLMAHTIGCQANSARRAAEARGTYTMATYIRSPDKFESDLDSLNRYQS